MNKTLLLLSSLTVHCSYRLKFFAAKDHLWDGNSHNCSLLGYKYTEGVERRIAMRRSRLSHACR